MVNSGIILLKYWLEVSPEEQTRRLQARISDGRKIWKLSDMDLKSYSRWYDYSRARDDMFKFTDTESAPWFVAKSDDKHRARLNVISDLLSRIPYQSVSRKAVKLPKRQKPDGYSEPYAPQVRPREVLMSRLALPAGSAPTAGTGSGSPGGRADGGRRRHSKSLAYATVAGLPVRVGLYTALVPMAIYALFGSSRALSVSTTTTIAILAGAALSQVSASGTADLATACASLTLLVGALLTLASVLRLGFVADFISEPVLVGFKAGIGVVIVVDQLPKLLGVHIQKGSFIHNLLAVGQGLPHTSMVALGWGLGTVALLVLLERFMPKAPAPLIAVVCGIVGMSVAGLDHLGLATVGTLPTGLPSLTWPSLALLEQLWPAALGIALMSFTESVAAGRAFAESKEPAPQPNRELLALGLANAGGAFLGAMPAGGGTTQTAVNREAGASSQMAGLVTAAVALASLLLLAPLIGLMPDATLAAVVIVYSVGLIKPGEFN